MHPGERKEEKRFGLLIARPQQLKTATQGVSPDEHVTLNFSGHAEITDANSSSGVSPAQSRFFREAEELTYMAGHRGDEQNHERNKGDEPTKTA